MQNKPNSLNVQIYINIYLHTAYEKFIPLAGQKNKPNSNPIKPNFFKGPNECKLTYNKGLQKKRCFVRINKPNSNPISERPKMNVSLFTTKDYENITTFKLRKNKPNQTQFHLPPKPPIFSQNNPPSILPGYQIIFHNHQILAIGFSGLIHVNSTGCLFYHFNGLWHLVQLWDLEYFATLTAVYPSVRGTAIKQPGTAAFRALGDNLHRYIPYTNSRILKRNSFGNNLNPKYSIYGVNRYPSEISFLSHNTASSQTLPIYIQKSRALRLRSARFRLI